MYYLKLTYFGHINLFMPLANPSGDNAHKG